MLRMLRRPGVTPARHPVHRCPLSADSHSRFRRSLTEFTGSLTRQAKSQACAKGTGLKSSLTLFLLFMTRPALAP